MNRLKLMNEGQIGFVVFGALMMFIAPFSIHVGIQRRSFVRRSTHPMRAFFQRGPRPALVPRLFGIGAGLGIVWVALWLTIFLA